MFERGMTFSMAALAVIMILLSPGQVSAQTADQDSSGADQAEVGDIEGEATTNFEFTIMVDPARPLIQFTNNRPAVSFSEVRVGPSSRSFYPEKLTAGLLLVN